MRTIIHKLHNIFNMIKGMDAGYTSENSKAMILNVDGVNYKLTIEKLNEGELSIDLIDKYL